MKILISVGPIIGVLVIVFYTKGIQIYAHVKGEKKIGGIYKKIYHWLILIEVLICVISIAVPSITGTSYLMVGMTDEGKIINTNEMFKISYKESNRGYSNTIELGEVEFNNLVVKCSCEEGKVFLRIIQDSNMKEIDITNMDAVLDLAGFEPGRITFTVVNEEAKNVKFQMKW